MQKKTVMSIWGIYGILAIAGTVGSYIWARKQWKSLCKCTETDVGEETE